MSKRINEKLKKLKNMQKKLQQRLDKSAMVKELKKLASSQKGFIRKSINNHGDLKRALKYVDFRHRELNASLKILPREVQTIKKYINNQKKEFNSLQKKLIKDFKDSQKKAKSSLRKKKATKKRRKKAKRKRVAKRRS